MRNQLVLFALSCFTDCYAQDQLYDDSLMSCRYFADTFDNTCESLDVAPSRVDYVPSKRMECKNVGLCTRDGIDINYGGQQTCKFDRKLCITCREQDGKVYIRAQSNNMPNHCFHLTQDTAKTKDIDFEVRWMSPTDKDKPINGRRNLQFDNDYQKSITQVATQDELNALVCDATRSRDRNINPDAEFSRIGLHNIDYAWGMSITGVLIWQGLNYEGVDPLYPTIYGSVYDPEAVKQKVDTCSLKTEISGYFQYYTAATCAGDSKYEDDTVEKMAEDADLLDMMRDAWDVKPYISVFGLSKDGRPIYGPFYNNGQAYTDCDVDVCNGKVVNGHYSYVSTMFHPYTMGCFGPGNNPPFSQKCTTNPRNCGALEPSAQGSVKIKTIKIIWQILSITAVLTIFN